jgi:hypothetical protein
MTKDEVAMLDELLGLEDGLSEWEIRFLDSLDGQRGRPLSVKQAAILDKMANRGGASLPSEGTQDL